MANEHGKNASTDEGAPLGAVLQLQEAGLGNMLGLGTAWVEAWSDMSAELAGFIADRIKEDVKTQHEILHCRTVGELQHIQAEFIQKAVDQYQAETGKLMEMGKKALTPDSKEPAG